MLLKTALRVQRGDVVSFVGAGGKTSALFRLANELRGEGWRVLATTTTRMAPYEVERAPVVMQLGRKVTAAEIRDRLSEHGFVFVSGEVSANANKIVGIDPYKVAGLVDSVDSDVLLIEADGARRLPLKAPYDHEPVIPVDTTLVVSVGGMDALGQPLDDEHIYNAERIKARYGFPDGAALIPPWMAVTLRDTTLGLRGVPASARVITLLNKVSAHGYDRLLAQQIARLVLRSERIEAVVLGAMQANEPVVEVQRRVAAVVLAAGQSVRMQSDRAMVLLPWDGRTVIEAIVARLMAARVPQIVVVTGHQGDAVARALVRLPVEIVHNPDYAQGEMLSSLKTGLAALPSSTAAAMVVLGDQPMLDGRVLKHVLGAYAEGQGEIVVPVHQGERGHPVIFSRRLWPDLLALESGAPRDVLRHYPEQLALVEVGTDSILQDIDTPEAYQRARFLAGLG